MQHFFEYFFETCKKYVCKQHFSVCDDCLQSHCDIISQWLFCIDFEDYIKYNTDKVRCFFMYKQKIGMSLENDYYSIPTVDVVRLLKKIGFEAISPSWKSRECLAEIVDVANECGLIIQSLHGPFGFAGQLWTNDESLYGPALEAHYSAIDGCVEFNIPIMVMHVWAGFGYCVDGLVFNFSNFDKLVDYAKKRGIKLALENTEGEEFLEALLEHYKNEDTVGYCWDSGHEMCYNRSKDFLGKYGDRLLVSHINDNLGIRDVNGNITWHDDMHLLPYDGVADWDYNIDRLKKANHLDILNFELNIYSRPERHENDVYAEMSIERYFTLAYQRACKIAYKYSR